MPERRPCPVCAGTGKVQRTSFADPSRQMSQACKACLGSGKLDPTNEELLATIDAQTARIAELEEAVKRYADPASYQCREVRKDEYIRPWIQDDMGQAARAVVGPLAERRGGG